jgi:hypothetical protein
MLSLIWNGAKQPVDRCLESPVTPRKWAPQANHFDCTASGVAYLSIHWGRPMLEAITAFLIILSVGIFVAHAMDAFRS